MMRDFSTNKCVLHHRDDKFIKNCDCDIWMNSTEVIWFGMINHDTKETGVFLFEEITVYNYDVGLISNARDNIL